VTGAFDKTAASCVKGCEHSRLIFNGVRECFAFATASLF
jgi:hypothetical protein